MPNPFSKKSKPTSAELKESVGNVELKRGGEVITALFECYTCYEGVKTATYYEKQRVLEWTCSQGHFNEERDIRIV